MYQSHGLSLTNSSANLKQRIVFLTSIRKSDPLLLANNIQASAASIPSWATPPLSLMFLFVIKNLLRIERIDKLKAYHNVESMVL